MGARLRGDARNGTGTMQFSPRTFTLVVIRCRFHAGDIYIYIPVRGIRTRTRPSRGVLSRLFRFSCRVFVDAYAVPFYCYLDAWSHPVIRNGTWVGSVEGFFSFPLRKVIFKTLHASRYKGPKIARGLPDRQDRDTVGIPGVSTGGRPG